MLYNKILLYSYILPLILYNAIGQQLTIKKKKKKHKTKSHQPKVEF